MQHTAEIKEKAPCLTKTLGDEVSVFGVRNACKSLREVKSLQIILYTTKEFSWLSGYFE